MKVLFAAVIVILGFATTNGLTMSQKILSKSEVFKAFRANDPVRTTVDFLGSSFASVFSPIPEYHSQGMRQLSDGPTKSMSISQFRRYHKKSGWAKDDLVRRFAASHILQYQKTPASKQSDQQQFDKEIQQIYASRDGDVADYIAHGVEQALSPMKYNPLNVRKALPPFKRQITLSELRDQPDYFAY